MLLGILLYILLLFISGIEVSYTYLSTPRLAVTSTSSLHFTTLEDLTIGVQDNPVTVKIPDRLQNRYLGLRHGQSMANIAIQKKVSKTIQFFAFF